MRIALLHNPTAGSASTPGDELADLVCSHGHELAHRSRNTDDLDRALDARPDLVLVAGGDGTVADVARRITGRNVPLGIIPVGTANNIARSLGVHGSPEAIVDRLDCAALRLLDVCTATGPWGSARFVESAGVGFFSDILGVDESSSAPRFDDDPSASRFAGIASLQDSLANARPRRYQVEADGVDRSGEYLLVIAMNIPAIGPRLCLAPTADPSDRRLDLILLGGDERDALYTHLESLGAGRHERINIESLRAARVRVAWNAGEGHLDDQPWPPNAHGARGMVDMAFLDAPISVLV